jgi:hypothetical protein
MYQIGSKGIEAEVTEGLDKEEKRMVVSPPFGNP